MKTAKDELPPVDALERRLINGGARWVADINEFFRDYRISGTVFDLYARGRTRSSGFLISRFFAWTVLPNYSVALFCINESEGSLGQETIRNRIETVTRVTKEDELQWAWLILFTAKNIQPSTVSFVSRYDKRELGLAIASTASKQIVLSNNQLGKSIEKYLRLSKALGVGKEWKP